MTSFYYCSVNHQSGLKSNTFSISSFIFFNTSKCATNYVILFEIYDGFVGQKILKLWRQESWLFGLAELPIWRGYARGSSVFRAIGHKFTFFEISSGLDNCNNKETLVVNTIYQCQQTQKSCYQSFLMNRSWEIRSEIQKNLYCAVAEDSGRHSELSAEQKPEQEHDKITDEGRKHHITACFYWQKIHKDHCKILGRKIPPIKKWHKRACVLIV